MKKMSNILKIQKSLTKQKLFIKEVINKRESIYSKRSEKWQLSDNGGIYESDTLDLEIILDNIELSIELLEEITHIRV